MKYFCVDTKTAKYVEVDETTDRTRVFMRGELERQKADAQARLAKIPPEPSDADLLAWAREKYPRVDYSKERRSLEEVIAVNEAVLGSLK